MASRKKNGPPKRLFPHVRPPATRPAGEEEMPDALVRLVEPQLESAKDVDTYRSVLRFGALAWNYAQMPEELRSRSLERFLDEVDDGDREAMRAFVLGIVRRKLDLFPDDRRLISSFEVITIDGRIHVTVATESDEPD